MLLKWRVAINSFLTFGGLLSVALNQHQAITDITKHSIEQRIFRREIQN
jgi:hypothetical protein